MNFGQLLVSGWVRMPKWKTVNILRLLRVCSWEDSELWKVELPDSLQWQYAECSGWIGIAILVLFCDVETYSNVNLSLYSFYCDVSAYLRVVLDKSFSNLNSFHQNGKLKLRNAHWSKPYTLRLSPWDELKVVSQKDGGEYELHLSSCQESPRTTDVCASANTLQYPN